MEIVADLPLAWHVKPDAAKLQGSNRSQSSNDETKFVEKSFGSSSGLPAFDSKPLEEDIFDRLVELRTEVARLSMHLSVPFRDCLYRQLDRLLDAEFWEDESARPKRSSFETFLRFVIKADVSVAPALGVSPSETILASWRSGDRVFSVEYFEDNQALGYLMKQTLRGTEAVTWRGHVADLVQFVERFLGGDIIRNGKEARSK